MPSTPPSSAPERWIRLAGTRNLRDVGGYPAVNGRQTRWRTLLRSDALDQLPAESQQWLLDLGLRQAIDLRWPSEVDASPSVFRASPAVRYRNLPLRDVSPSPIGGIPGSYRRIVDDRGEQLAGVARALLEPDGLAAIVSCAAGVDRSGLAVAIVLATVGVPADVIAADYALSVESYRGDGSEAGLVDWRSEPIALDCRPDYLLSTLDYLEQRHGGAAGFLAAHGLTDRDLARLTELLTEPIAMGEAGG